MKPFLTSVGAVALAASALMLASRLLPLLGTLLLAVALAATAEAMVRFCVRRGWSRNLAIAVTYCTGLGFWVTLFVVVLPPLGDEVAKLAKTPWPAILQGVLPSAATLTAAHNFHWQELFEGLLVFGESTASAVVVLVLAVYASVHRSSVTTSLHGLAQARHRGSVRRVLEEMEIALGLHVMVETLASGVTLVAVFLISQAQGLSFPVLLACSIALLRLIPFLGPPLCLAVALLAGSSLDITGALVTALAVLAIERLANALANSLLGYRKHNAFLVLVCSIGTVKLGGWAGLLVAPALASVIEVAGSHLRAVAQPHMQVSPLPERLALLAEGVLATTPSRQRKLQPLLKKLREVAQSAQTSTPDSH